MGFSIWNLHVGIVFKRQNLTYLKPQILTSNDGPRA